MLSEWPNPNSILAIYSHMYAVQTKPAVHTSHGDEPLKGHVKAAF